MMFYMLKADTLIKYRHKKTNVFADQDYNNGYHVMTAIFYAIV